MTLKRFVALFAVLTALGTGAGLCADSGPASDRDAGSSPRPLPPEYVIHSDGSVRLRICYNWSCSNREYVTFTARDMDAVRHNLNVCAGESMYDRLQRLRIAVWQMEALAEKYQPLLGNDLAINDYEYGVNGRTDCIDNASNTTTFLQILQDLGEMPGWSVAPPVGRNFLVFFMVHWTAVVSDEASGDQWSVDSWYRPHGHLPFVLPLANWLDEDLGWISPFTDLNPYPQYTSQLCEGSPSRTAAASETRTTHD